MKLKNLVLPILFFAGLISCNKQNNDTKISTEKDTKTTEIQKSQVSANTLKIDTINVPESKIGVGCLTVYSKKGSNQQEMLYMQTGAPDEIGWISILNINGKQIEFPTKNESTYEDETQNLIITKFENTQYKVVIEAKLGNVNLESDSTGASGVITVTDKKTNETGSIEFEGGTSC